jgi:hypothetical protein
LKIQSRRQYYGTPTHNYVVVFWLCHLPLYSVILWVREERDYLIKTKKEIAEGMRQRFLTQSDTTKIEETCQQLQADLERLSTQVEIKREKLKDADDKLVKDTQ